MLDILGAWGGARFIVFTLVLVRTSGLVITAPIFGGNQLPSQIRVLLALALAVLIAPTQVGVVPQVAGNLPAYLVAVTCETLIGLVLGLGIQIVQSGMLLAGQIVGQLSGLSMAEVLDPTSGDDVPLLSQLLNMLALAVFCTIGGHRLVMAGLLETFAALPPGSMLSGSSLVDTTLTLAMQSCELGIRAAAPAAVALLVTNVALGFISRTLPQLNVISFGFGVGVVVMLMALSATLGSIAWVAQEYFEEALGTMRGMMSDR